MKALFIVLLLVGIAWGDCLEGEWEECLTFTDSANEVAVIEFTKSTAVTCTIRCIEGDDIYTCQKWQLSRKECPNIEIVE